MLIAADIFFTFLHVLIIGFNMFGWIWKRTRKAHIVVLILTILSWLVVGLFVGNIGYCFLTDWHWDIKRQLGENQLPPSFVKYYADLLLGIDTNTGIIDLLTALGLIFGVVMAVIKYRMSLNR